MKTFVISSSTYIIEAAAELLLISSLIGKKKKDLLSPFLPLIFICGIINNALFIFIPNVLGWFLAFPISLITYSIILRIRVSACIFPFLLSFATCGLIEAITVIIFPFAIFTLSDVSTQLVGNCVIFIISIFISLLPLNKLYLFANKGKLIFKLILSYVSLLYIVTVALTKIDSIENVLPKCGGFIFLDNLFEYLSICFKENFFELKKLNLSAFDYTLPYHFIQYFILFSHVFDS